LLPVTGATQQHVSEKGEKIAIVMGNGKCFSSWNKENRRTLLIPKYVQEVSHDVYKSDMTCMEKKCVRCHCSYKLKEALNILFAPVQKCTRRERTLANLKNKPVLCA